MANIKTAKKRILINQRKAAANKSARTELKTAIKKAEFALENNTEDKAEVVKSAIVKLDKASNKGILHSNTTARKKSQLARKLQNS